MSSRWQLKGKNVLVTGGTKGIGLACVKEFLSLNAAKVLICARTKESVDGAISSLKDERVRGCVCDVSSKKGRETLVSFVKDECGETLDCLVNNVGTNRRKAIEESTEEEYTTIMRTNVDSCFFLSKNLAAMLKKAKGSIVNVASVAGIRSSGTGSIYAMSKGAMVQLTRALACEFAPHGVRVNCVAPWMTWTPLLKEAVKKDPTQVDVAASATPLQRLAEPEESAGVVVFLCLPASSYVTGQIVAVDGGISAQGFQGPCAQPPKNN